MIVIFFPLWVLGIILVVCCVGCVVAAIGETLSQPPIVIVKTVLVLLAALVSISIIPLLLSIKYGLWE